jgi:hypothetical protein
MLVQLVKTCVVQITVKFKDRVPHFCETQRLTKAKFMKLPRHLESPSPCASISMLREQPALLEAYCLRDLSSCRGITGASQLFPPTAARVFTRFQSLAPLSNLDTNYCKYSLFMLCLSKTMFLEYSATSVSKLSSQIGL